MNTIGIIGAGQLGMMLGVAAKKLGFNCIFLDPSENPPAAAVGQHIAAAFDDTVALAELAAECDVITYEFENVPVAAIRTIESICPALPPPRALELAQDRLAEKQLFESLQIPLPGYRAIDSVDDLQQAAKDLGLPLVVKTRRLGYDGKGQAILRNQEDAQALFQSLGGADLIAEQFVAFEREVSALGARSNSGNIVVYPLSENEHRDGILRVSIAADGEEQLTALATDYLDRLLAELKYVGVLALELFVVGDQLLANEFAPRVHNSGHWTIEGTTASQFENHLRAIAGIPLTEPALVGYPAMVNIIGTMTEPAAIAGLDDVVVHDYRKTARKGRKLGHATFVGDSIEARDATLRRLRQALAG